MTNSSLPNSPSCGTNSQPNGITEIRQRNIAYLIARGFPVRYVAKKLHMSESRIYHLLSDKDSFVNAELNRLLGELFTENDRDIVTLFNRILDKLKAMLLSPNEEEQLRAMDRIIKIYMARSAKKGITVKQYFGLEAPGEREITWDDYIKHSRKISEGIEKSRKERGLPSTKELLDFAEQNYPSPTPASPTPASETPASNESPQNNSTPEICAPSESSRGPSPPDTPPEITKSVDVVEETPPSE